MSDTLKGYVLILSERFRHMNNRLGWKFFSTCNGLSRFLIADHYNPYLQPPGDLGIHRIGLKHTPFDETYRYWRVPVFG